MNDKYDKPYVSIHFVAQNRESEYDFASVDVPIPLKVISEGSPSYMIFDMGCFKQKIERAVDAFVEAYGQDL